jgi:hypothetical protein
MLGMLLHMTGLKPIGSTLPISIRTPTIQQQIDDRYNRNNKKPKHIPEEHPNFVNDEKVFR